MKTLSGRLLDAQTARETAEEQLEALTRDLETAVTAAEEHQSNAEKLEVRKTRGPSPLLGMHNNLWLSVLSCGLHWLDPIRQCYDEAHAYLSTVKSSYQVSTIG